MKRRFTYLLAALALLTFLNPMTGLGQPRDYEELYSATFTEVANHSYTQNKTFTLNGKSWTASVSQVNSGVFYLGCNSTHASKGVLNNNSTFSAEVTALRAEDAVYNTNYETAHAYGLQFNNAYDAVTKVEFNWSGGNNAFQVYLFGDSGSGYVLLGHTNYATSGASIAGSVAWTGTATNYTKFAIVARPGATNSTATSKTLRADTFKIYKTSSSGPTQLAAPVLDAEAGNGQVTLTWAAVSNASSYNIQYADNDNFTSATTIENATSPKVISGLTNNTTYYFKAMSVGDGTDYLSSGYGTVKSATPFMPQLDAPVLVAEAGNGQVTLTWADVSNASSYTIQYADNANFTGATTVENATSPKVISGLTNNTTYYFKAMSVGNGTDYISSNYGTAVNATPSNLVTITITQDNLIDFTNQYNWYTWTSGGIEGYAYAYKSGGIQVNPSKDGGPDCIYNTTPIPGIIKSIKMVKASGTTRSWTVTVGNTTLESPDAGQTLPAQEVNTGTTWNVEGNYTNFLLSVSGGSTVIGSIEIKYEPRTQYAVNVDVNSDYGTITAMPTAAIEGATVSLSATATDDYRFESFTVLDANNSPVAVTSTGATTGTFTMPACAVTVGGIYTRIYTAIVAGPYTGGTVIASPEKAAEGETVELTATAVDHYTFASWSVNAGTLSSTTDNPTTLTMPADDVTVDATFTRNTYTVTYCVNGNSALIPSQQVLGGNSIGSFPEDPEYGDYSFLGWSSNENIINYVADSYIPMGDMTLYAVFGTTDEATLTITGNTSGIPTSYGSGNWTIDSKTFYQSQILYQNPNQNKVIQFKSGAGILYNKTDFGAIHSIVITYYSGTAAKVVSVKAGTSQNPTSADALDAFEDGNVYTYALPENCHYFLLTNGSGTSQVSSIEIYYEILVPESFTITRIKDAQTRTADIPATEFVIVENGGILTFTGANNGTSDNLVIEDGGQIVLNENNGDVYAKVQKNITGYGNGNGNWYLLSAPTEDGLNANPDYPSDCEVVNLMPADIENVHMFDLYSFDQTKDAEWQNFRASGVINKAFDKQKGLLYARKESATIEFNVELTAAPNNNHRMLYEANAEFAGWNLVGNAMMCDQYVGLYCDDECVSTDYYRMNAAGTALELCENGAPVAPMEGFFVQAPSDAQNYVYLHFSSTPLVDNNNAIDLNVTYDNAIVDRARVRFGEGSMLGKFTLNENNTKLYIPQGSKDYAVVRSANEGEMPVSFKAETRGTYTLTVNPEGVEMNYLHLIDNMTGADVDLLATPSYSFEAKTSDYASRFRLVFSANNTDEDGASTSSATFAYFNGSSWTISNMGEATLQVVDVMGRVLSSEQINGNAEININQPTGVYMLRLVNGDNVKVQKVVVR